MKLELSRVPICALGRRIVLLAIVSACASVSVAAHAGRGLNGGQLADAGSGHVEFIGGPGYQLLIFAISDKAQKPVSAKGSAAVAFIDQNGKQFRVPLAVEDDNFLSASVGLSLIRGSSVWFVARLPTGETVKVQFIAK